MSFSPEETAVCRHLIELALSEDLGAAGDITSEAVIPTDLAGRAVFVARADGVLAGLPAAALVAAAIEPRLQFDTMAHDGDRVEPGQQLAIVAGPMPGILASERIALNFLQHLSGIASLTRQYVDAVAGLPTKILDTRKTLPGWRLLAKYAVRMGGGHNHRLGLHDGILIKDNHLAALGQGLPAVTTAVRSGLDYTGKKSWVQVEVDTLAQLEVALACRPDMVLLDNMPPPLLRQAVSLRDARAPGVLLEASGGVNLQTVRAIAEAGVDRISVGALTHSAPALDIALDYMDVPKK